MKNYFTIYRALYGFGQAKFSDSCSVLGLIGPIFNSAPAASENDALFKSGQNQLENKQLALLILIRDTLCT